MITRGIRMTSLPEKPSPEQFLDQLNKDVDFRNKFLDRPVDTMREFGFPLELEVAKQIEEVVSLLKDDLRHIFELPSGHVDFLKRMGFTIKMPPHVEFEQGPDMITG